MVSKLRSFSAPVASRKASSFATASFSSGGLTCPSVATHWRKLVRAAPSRIWARRVPSISTAFLQARGRVQGSMPRTTVAPSAARASKYQAEDCAGSTSTFLPFRSLKAPARASGASRVTWLPSHAGSSSVTLAGSRNSRAVPSAPSTAWPMGRGERITSPPRTLNSQAIEAGAVITAASAPSFARLWPTLARLAADSSPANSSGWGEAGAGAGRGGAVRDARGGPGRAGEAGGPGEAVVGRRQVLVLVLVLVRDEEAVQTLGLHGRAL